MIYNIFNNDRQIKIQHDSIEKYVFDCVQNYHAHTKGMTLVII